jgi:hypothetical protein
MHGISLRLGLIWFFGATVFCTIGWLALCWWVSTLPVVIDVSISLALQPWWKGWEVSLFVGFLLGLIIGVLAAFHPVNILHQRKPSRRTVGRSKNCTG